MVGRRFVCRRVPALPEQLLQVVAGRGENVPQLVELAYLPFEQVGVYCKKKLRPFATLHGL